MGVTKRGQLYVLDNGRPAALGFEYIEGTGSPEGVVTADVGAMYVRTDGGANQVFYMKESDPGSNTGWIAYGSPSSISFEEQEFTVSTANVSEFTISGFTLSATKQVDVEINGVKVFETRDWTRSAPSQKILLVEPISGTADNKSYVFVRQY